MGLPINHTDLTAKGAKKLASKALKSQPTFENTEAFANTVLAAVNVAANAGSFNYSTAVPGGLNNNDLTKFFTGLGYSVQLIAGTVYLDWTNPASRANQLKNRENTAFFSGEEPQED